MIIFLKYHCVFQDDYKFLKWRTTALGKIWLFYNTFQNLNIQLYDYRILFPWSLILKLYTINLWVGWCQHDLRPQVAAKSLQSCPTLCDPIDGSPPGSPSLGFSRQEHWSRLPFPSPMHESESEAVSDPQRPHRLQPSRLFRPWDFPGKSTGVGCHCLLQDLRLVGPNHSSYAWGFLENKAAL